MRYLLDHIRRMQGYVPGEQPKDGDWVKLNQNENPYPPSPAVAEAVAAEAGRLAHYPASSSPRVRKAAAKLFGITTDRVLVANGSDEMLRILFQACVAPGEEVAAFDPSYTYYQTLADIQGARLRRIDFTDDYELPERLALDGVKLVFLPNPNAPSGTLFSEGDIARLAAAARDGLVVVDEAYADFAGASAIPMLGETPNLFVTRTLSKSYSLAGLRVGLGFGSAEFVRELDKVRDYYNVDRLAQAAAAAALEDQDSLRASLRRIAATRARLVEALEPLADRVWPTAANFVLARFVDPPAAAIFAELRARRVLVRHFDRPRLSDCLRITVGTDEETDAFLGALRAILSR